MTHARFCLLSLVLVVLAIAAHGGAINDWSRNARIRAHAASVTPEQRAGMSAEADGFSRRGSVFHAVGMCLAVATAGSLVVSFRRHEPVWWRPVPVALLVFYVVFQFVLV